MKPETRAYLEHLARNETLPLAVQAVLKHLYAASTSLTSLSAFAKHCAAFKILGDGADGGIRNTNIFEGVEKPPSVN